MSKEQLPRTVIESSVLNSLSRLLTEARSELAKTTRALDRCYMRDARSATWLLDPFAVLAFLADLQANEAVTPRLAEAELDEIKAWAKSGAEAAAASFDGEIRRLCTENRVAIEGQHPSYKIGEVVSVRVLDTLNGCTVAGATVASLFAPRVWSAASRVLADDLKHRIAPDSLLALCQRAYAKAVLQEQFGSTGVVPIRILYRELVIELQPDKFWRSPTAENWQAYSLQQFQRDLGRLSVSGPFVTSDGQRLELTPTSFAKQGLPIESDSGIRYIGGLSFSRNGA